MKILFFILSFSTFASTKPLALVYQGDGACPQDCSTSLGNIVEKMGYKVTYVDPSAIRPEIFSHAKIWIQPGGVSSEVAKALTSDQKKMIKNFIKSGGSYLGICAGTFFAAKWIASNRSLEGLGLLPESQELYEPEDASIVDITWSKKLRHIYFEGGPYIINPQEREPLISSFTPVAFYPNQEIAAAKFHFGKGKVFQALIPKHQNIGKNIFHYKTMMVPMKTLLNRLYVG